MAEHKVVMKLGKSWNLKIFSGSLSKLWHDVVVVVVGDGLDDVVVLVLVVVCDERATTV